MANRRRLFWRLYPTYLLVILLSILGVGVFSLRSFRTFYLEQTVARLEETARGFSEDLSREAPSLMAPDVHALAKTRGRAASTRITVVLPAGKVLGDSDHNPASMENHADRPEIQAALSGGTGQSIRYSATLGFDMMYLAVPVEKDGRVAAVVRAAVPLKPIQRALGRIYLQIALGAVILVILVGGVGMWVSSRLSKPLKQMMEGAGRFARGELDHKLAVPDTEEIGGLAESLNRMARQLDEKIRTITRQRNEQEAVLASMVEGVVAIDPEGRILSLNHAAGTVFGFGTSDAIGRPLTEIVRNVNLDDMVSRILRGREAADKDVTLRQDDEDRFLRVRGTSLRDAAGQQIGALLVVHDVTRLRRLEMVRRDFVANVSHELKTPITSIHGFVETLQDGAIDDPEKARRFLDIIRRQSERLNAIIEDLMDLSRIEQQAETETIERALTDLGLVLEAAVADCAAKAAARNVDVKLHVARSLSARINARMVEQAVANLLDNAIKYSNPGASVEVSVEQSDSTVTIRVRDQGSGIAPQHLPRIFERFYRAEKARSREVGGTGLGLAIVKHIAQAHGGSVSVESTPGQGSLFAFHLPAS